MGASRSTLHPFELKYFHIFCMTDSQKKGLMACQKVAEALKEHRFSCLYPGCGEQSIMSHSQQKKGALKWIQQDGKVYAIKRRIDSYLLSNIQTGNTLPLYCEVPVSKATTFPGFCGRHDKDLFDVIEKPEGLTKDDPLQVLALYRRAIAYSLANRRNSLNVLLGIWKETMKHGKLGNGSIDAELCKYILNWGIMLPYDIDYTLYPSFADDALGRLSWAWRVIPQNIGLSCVSGIPPLNDDEGDRLVGDLINYDTKTMKAPRPIVAFNIIPERDRTHIVLVWDKQFSAYVKKIEKNMSSSSPSEFERFINEIVLNRSEDFTMSPSLWNSLSYDEKTVVRQLIQPEHMREEMKTPRVIKISNVL